MRLNVASQSCLNKNRRIVFLLECEIKRFAADSAASNTSPSSTFLCVGRRTSKRRRTINEFTSYKEPSIHKYVINFRKDGHFKHVIVWLHLFAYLNSCFYNKGLFCTCLTFNDIRINIFSAWHLHIVSLSSVQYVRLFLPWLLLFPIYATWTTKPKWDFYFRACSLHDSSKNRLYQKRIRWPPACQHTFQAEVRHKMKYSRGTLLLGGCIPQSFLTPSRKIWKWQDTLKLWRV